MHDDSRFDARLMTLPQILRWHAQHTPNQTALRQKRLGVWEAISWRQYYEAARGVALGLRALGLQRGDRIAVASEGTPAWFFADLGAEMIGVETVGIHPTVPAGELHYIARHSGARVAICGDQEQTDKIITARDSEDGLPALVRIVCVNIRGLRRYDTAFVGGFEAFVESGRNTDANDEPAARWLDAEIDAGKPDDVSAVVYTSGTSGLPKGALLSHANLAYAATAFSQAAGLQGHRFESVCYLPPCEVAERCYSLVLHLVEGGIVNFAESTDTIQSDIREIAPTFFFGGPRIWEKLQQDLLFRSNEPGNRWNRPFQAALRRGRLLADRRHAGQTGFADRLELAFWKALLLGNVQSHMGLDRTVVRICGGASVSPETLRFFDVIGLPLYQGYGLTESSGFAFVQRPSTNALPGACGPVLDGSVVRFGPDQEILLQSPGVFKGYLNDEAATAAALTADGWLHTGDIGRIDDTGELTIVDRKKDIIVTRTGRNVAPSQIENALKDSPYIREAIVVGDDRQYLGGLIQIDFGNVGRWAGSQSIAFTTFKSLATHDKVKALIQDIVDQVNARREHGEAVQRIVVLDRQLDCDTGEMTATQKIRRAVVTSRFARELEQIYGDNH